MSKTTELVERLRELPRDTRKATVEIYDLCIEASYEIEELVDRCARYAEEIAVLQEKQKWVDVREKLPERDGHYLCRYVFGSGGRGFYGTLDYYAIDPRPHFQHEGSHGMNVTHFRFDGYARAQDAETVLPDTVQGIENWLKEEMTG